VLSSRFRLGLKGDTEERGLEDLASSSDSQELLDASVADYRSGLSCYLGWFLVDTWVGWRASRWTR